MGYIGNRLRDLYIARSFFVRPGNFKYFAGSCQSICIKTCVFTSIFWVYTGFGSEKNLNIFDQNTTKTPLSRLVSAIYIHFVFTYDSYGRFTALEGG